MPEDHTYRRALQQKLNKGLEEPHRIYLGFTLRGGNIGVLWGRCLCGKFMHGMPELEKHINKNKKKKKEKTK